MTRLCRWLALALVWLCACQDPTQITIEVSTDLPCGELTETGIAVGSLSELPAQPIAATSTECDPVTGRIGSLVAIPADEGSSEVAFRVISSVGGDLVACETPSLGDNCIISRRALGYLEHTKLKVPVMQREACIGKPCSPDTTCNNGECVPAFVDPSQCVGDGCGEDTLPSPPGLTHGWTYGFGGPANHEYGWGVAVGSGGDVYLLAEVGTGATFDATVTDDLAVVRFDPDGNPRWAYTNLSGLTRPRGLAISDAGHAFYVGWASGTGDYGDGAIGGMSRADILIGSVDSSGMHGWAYAYGSSSNLQADHAGTDVAVAPGARVVFTGLVGAGDVTIAATAVAANSLFVATLTAKGEPIWVRGYPGNASDPKLAIDSAGNSYVAGGFAGTLAIGDSVTAVDGQDIFLAKLDVDGTVVWAQRFGGVDNEQLDAIAIGLDDSVYLSGSLQSPVDFGGGAVGGSAGLDTFVARFEPNGDHTWSQASRTDSDDLSFALAVDPLGNLLHSLRSDSDNILTSYTSDGTLRFSQTFSGAMSAFLVFQDIAVGPAGEVVATGSHTGDINFGGRELSTGSIEETGGFLVKFLQR